MQAMKTGSTLGYHTKTPNKQKKAHTFPQQILSVPSPPPNTRKQMYLSVFSATFRGGWGHAGWRLEIFNLNCTAFRVDKQWMGLTAEGGREEARAHSAPLASQKTKRWGWVKINERSRNSGTVTLSRVELIDYNCSESGDFKPAVRLKPSLLISISEVIPEADQTLRTFKWGRR